MGLAGVRTPDNAELFDAKKPLVVVYFSVDYTHNPKGERTLLYGDGSLSLLVLSLLQLMDGMLSDISLFHPPVSSHSPHTQAATTGETGTITFHYSTTWCTILTRC